MIVSLALAILIQSKPAIDLKKVWAVTADQTGHAVLVRRRNGHAFRFLRRSLTIDSPDARDFCNLDAQDGTVLKLTTRENFHRGTAQAPDDLEFSLASDGELQMMGWDGVIRKWTLVEDGDGLEFVEGLNHFWEPVKADQAEKSFLPPIFIRVKDVGDVQILSDGEVRRVAFVGDEVRSYKPRSWQVDKTLVAKEELFNQYRKFTSPQLIGDPQTGPFAIANGDRGAAATEFFDQGLNKLSVPKQAWCFDASANGFLVEPRRADDALGSLECIDAKTGRTQWLKPNFESQDALVEWVGHYVVTISGRKANTEGELCKVLTVLDGDTGATTLEKLIPVSMSLWQPSGLDDMILMTDDDGNLFGYQIVKK